MPEPLVILACGNPARGDDALGPLLLARAEAWLAGRPGLAGTVEDFQFQVEHALDLEGRELVLFLDAAASGPAPFHFRPLAPERDGSFTSHALSPAAVLQAYRQVHGAEPPPAFVLGVRGQDFELGSDLSPAAAAHLEAAWALLRDLLAEPRAGAWTARAGAWAATAGAWEAGAAASGAGPC